MKRLPKFQTGHVYQVLYDDHWSSDRVYRDSIDNEACALKTTGVCIKETDLFVVLEHGVCESDSHATNKRSTHSGIIKSAIRRVTHYGRE